jgi:hypothetical protein
MAAAPHATCCSCCCPLQARRLGVQELQCQAWGGSADALEASSLALLELDPEFITVSRVVWSTAALAPLQAFLALCGGHCVCLGSWGEEGVGRCVGGALLLGL